MATHKQSRITPVGRMTKFRGGLKRFRVDKAIVPLIKALWRKDIMTVHSCQDNGGGMMIIGILTTSSCFDFLQLCAASSNGRVSPLLNRMADGWKWQVIPYMTYKDGEWAFMYNVLLPIDDYELVLKAVI